MTIDEFYKKYKDGFYVLNGETFKQWKMDNTMKVPKDRLECTLMCEKAYYGQLQGNSKLFNNLIDDLKWLHMWLIFCDNVEESKWIIHESGAIDEAVDVARHQQLVAWMKWFAFMIGRISKSRIELRPRGTLERTHDAL